MNSAELETKSDPIPVAVLGATGRIGRLLSVLWKQERFGHIAPRWQGRRIAGSVDETGCFDYQQDPVRLEQFLQGVEAVLVLSGVTPTTAGPSQQQTDNIDMAKAAIAAARAAGVSRVLLTSSGAVYGRAAGVLDEDTPLAPLNDYGRAKQEMEQAARSADDDMKITCLRIGNVAGADQLLGPGERDITLDVFADGQGPARSYIGPTLLAEVLAELLVSVATLPAALNVSAPGAVTMDALVTAAGLKFTARAAPDGLIPTVALDVSRLATLVDLPSEAGSANAIAADWRMVTGGQPW